MNVSIKAGLLFAGIFFLQNYARGQCENSAIYHTPNLILASGDTLNQTDANGYYIGEHVYAENDTFLFNDTIAYIRGLYVHGTPVGEWTVHCKNGDYARGYFACCALEPVESNGHSYNRLQGVAGKTGIWKYYRNDGTLIKTLKYVRKDIPDGLYEKVYYLAAGSRPVLIRYSYAKGRLKHTGDKTGKPEKEIEKRYSYDGRLYYWHISNAWQNKTKEYYTNGKLKDSWKCVRILGVRINRSVFKMYSEDGKLLERSVKKCTGE